MTAIPAIERLELDVDTRIANLWRDADHVSEWSLETVAVFLRAAYGIGYCDALRDHGQLCIDHGYRVPA